MDGYPLEETNSMADKQNKNQLRMNTQDTIALGRSHAGLGVARGVISDIGYRSVAVPAPVSTRFAFMLAEITGLLFVALTTIYIFAMPTSLTRGGRMDIMISDLIKRTIDIVGASVGLILSLPILIITALLVKLESRGQIFYSQIRVGQNRRNSQRRYLRKSALVSEDRRRERRREDYHGQLFRVYKFRSMVIDAESKSGPVWATKGDPRITRIGRFLRKTRIDEIPQFWCVLKGDMSLVGPRPERPHFVSELSGKIEGYAGRLDAKPGLTGLAQVDVGYDSTIASVVRKVESDLEYIHNRSLWLDIKIMLKTIIVVFTGKGAN